MELSSKGQTPYSTGFPRLGEHSVPPTRNPSVPVYQLALLCAAAFGFREIIFEGSFNAFSYFMTGDALA